jgi:hypothetical protein
MKTNLIALSGRAGSGKDTVAGYIKENLFPYPVNILALADPIREGAKTMFSFTQEEITDRSLKEMEIQKAITFPNSLSPYLDWCMAGLISMFGENESDWPYPKYRMINKIGQFMDKYFYIQKSGFACKKSPRQIMQWLGTEFGRNMISENVWIDLATKKIMDNREEISVVTDCRFSNEADAFKKMGGYIVGIFRPDGKDRTLYTGHSSEIIDFTADEDIFNDGDLDSLREKVDDMIERVFE